MTFRVEYKCNASIFVSNTSSFGRFTSQSGGAGRQRQSKHMITVRNSLLAGTIYLVERKKEFIVSPGTWSLYEYTVFHSNQKHTHTAVWPIQKCSSFSEWQIKFQVYTKSWQYPPPPPHPTKNKLNIYVVCVKSFLFGCVKFCVRVWRKFYLLRAHCCCLLLLNARSSGSFKCWWNHITRWATM